ncbi:MAG TPA: hypothetical protein QGI71_10455 [Dehalococcoidia bacterium]|nr:hypothetical protein [Dehalococcoidia bacterium]
MLLSAALWSTVAGQSAGVLAEGGIDSSFEAWIGSEFAGWSISRGSLTVAGPVQAGAGAADAEAADSGTIVVSSKFWLVNVVEGVEYTLRAWIYDDAASISGLTIELELTDSSGVRIGKPESASLLGDASAYQQLSTSSLTAIAGAAHVRVHIRAVAAAAEATFRVDSVTVAATTPPPPTPSQPAVPEKSPERSRPAAASATPASWLC